MTFTLTLNTTQCNSVFNQTPHLINTLPRNQIIAFLSSVSYNALEIIKNIKPALTLSEIGTISGNNQKRALSYYLKTAGSPEDYINAIQYDGTYLKSIPIAKRTQAMINLAIDSGVLPSFDSIPKKFRQPSHKICQKYFLAVAKLSEAWLIDDRGFYQLFSYKFSLKDFVESLHKNHPKESIRLVNSWLLMSPSSLSISMLLQNLSPEAKQFLLDHAQECFPPIAMLEFPGYEYHKRIGNFYFDLTEKLRFPISSLNSFPYKNDTPADVIVAKQQEYFTLSDAINALEGSKMTLKRACNCFPIIQHYKTELELLAI